MKKLIEQFDEIRMSYAYSFIGLYAISTDKYRDLIGNNFTLLVGTSFKKDINLPISKIIDEYQENSNKISIMNDCTYSSQIFNLIYNSKYYSKLSEYSELKLLFHISRAALNSNIFDLDKKVLPENVLWRDKKITIRRNGKPCFYKFMSAGDLFILFEDISRVLKNS